MAAKNERWMERQAAIRDLLSRERVGSQADLGRRLAARGFEVTQSSISRDLQELRVAKLDGRYVLNEALRPGTAADELALAARAIRALRPAGPNLLVIQTPAAQANAVAVAIDRAAWPEVAGTLAGDDTIFLATTGRRQQARLAARLAGLTRGGLP